MQTRNALVRHALQQTNVKVHFIPLHVESLDLLPWQRNPSHPALLVVSDEICERIAEVERLSNIRIRKVERCCVMLGVVRQLLRIRWVSKVELKCLQHVVATLGKVGRL